MIIILSLSFFDGTKIQVKVSTLIFFRPVLSRYVRFFFLFCFQCKLLLESQTIVTQLLEISYIQKPYKGSLQNDGSFQTKLKCDHSIYLVQKNECCYLGFVKGVIVAVVIASVVIYRLTTSTFNGEVLFTVEYVGLGGANAVDKSNHVDL